MGTAEIAYQTGRHLPHFIGLLGVFVILGIVVFAFIPGELARQFSYVLIFAAVIPAALILLSLLSMFYLTIEWDNSDNQ